MLENINLAFQGVWSHKMRSFLTMLGIIIGIAAIITIVSTIQGTNEQIKQNLIGAGNNVVRVQLTQDGNEISLDYSDIPQGVSTITEDMRSEMSQLGSVADVSLYHQRQWPDGVYVGDTSFSGTLYGIDSHFLSAADYAVNYGRSFVESDFASCRKVALIDTKSAQSLFQGENPIGGTLEISGEPFTVVGVVSSRVSSEPVINSINDYYMYSGSTSGTIFIPDSCWPIVYRYDEPQYAAVRAVSTNDSWFQDSRGVWMHNAQSSLRAIETGRYVVRAGNTGVSSVIDPTGQVTAELDPLLTGYVPGTVRLCEERTLYTRIGNLFAYLCAALCAAAVLANPAEMVVRRLRAGRKSE